MKTASDPMPDVEQVLADQVPVIPVLTVQLGETIRQIEDAVVGVCNSFEGIAQRSRDSVARTTRFLVPADRSGRDPGLAKLIEDSKSTFERLLDCVAKSGEQSAKAIDRLDAVKDRSAEINRALAGLNEIAFGNRLVAVNARIEAAHIGAQAASFNVVADEIQTQARYSARIVDSISAVTKQLNEAVSSAIELLETSARRDQEMLNQSRLEVEATINSLSTALALMRGFLDETVRQGEQLANEVSGAIRGMQFQDRASQRLNHVIEALDDMHQALSPLSQQGEGQTSSAVQRLTARYTMAEENVGAGVGQGAGSGDYELF